MTNICEVKDIQTLDSIFSLAGAIVLKNSPYCGISRMARRELERFMNETNKDVPVFMIDVIDERDISRMMAQRTGVSHESPQAFYLEHGEVKWHASHYGITVEAIVTGCGEQLNDQEDARE